MKKTTPQPQTMAKQHVAAHVANAQAIIDALQKQLAKYENLGDRVDIVDAEDLAELNRQLADALNHIAGDEDFYDNHVA